MMKYEIFKDVVENAVLDYLPPEFQNSELHLQRVKKVNGMDYDGLVVRKEDTNVCPVINLTQLYEDYKLSEDIELVTKMLQTLYCLHMMKHRRMNIRMYWRRDSGIISFMKFQIRKLMLKDWQGARQDS